MNIEKHADVLKLVGRVFIAIIFIVSGFGKIMGFAGTVAFTGTVLPFPELMVVIAIILELGGGLLLLVGYQTRLVVSALGLFLIVATLGFHLDFADQAQNIQFMKNLAIFGGLLYVKIGGAGKYSLDR